MIIANEIAAKPILQKKPTPLGETSESISIHYRSKKETG